MAVASFPEPSIAAQLAELKREKVMRARVYPSLVSARKLTQHAADYQNLCLDAAIRSLERLAAPEPEDGPANIKELYGLAIAIVAREQKCSVSLVQHQLRIGYNVAARLVEWMEREGVVSPADETGKRRVFLTTP